MNALILPTEHGEQCSNLARISEIARDCTRIWCWWRSYHQIRLGTIFAR